MSSNNSHLPDSVKARFPEHLISMASQFETNRRFREVCADYEEIMIDLANSSSTASSTVSLKSLARELEVELLEELELAGND